MQWMTDLFSYIVSPALNRSTCCEELPQWSSSPYGKHIGGYKEPRRQPKGLPLDQSVTLRKTRAVYGDNTTNQRWIMGQSHERKSHQNLNPNQSPGPSYCEVHAGLQRNLIQVSLLACSLIMVMYMFFAMMFCLVSDWLCCFSACWCWSHMVLKTLFLITGLRLVQLIGVRPFKLNFNSNRF